MLVGVWGNLYAENDITNTYLTNANLSDINSGWTYYSDDFKYTDWKTDGDVPVVEFYSQWSPNPQSMTRKDFKFSQTTTLPAGNYRLAVNAFYRNGNGDGTNENKAWIFVKGTNIDKTNNVAALTSAGVGAYVGGSDLYKAANAFSRGDFSNEFDFSLDEETTVEIGFQGFFNLTLSWCILGPVKLYLYTVEDYLADYNAKVTEAQALYNSPMNATVLSELQAAVVDPETFSEASQVISAIDLLKEKITAAQASIAIYEKINEYLTYTQGKVTGDYSAVTTKITNGEYTTFEEAVPEIKSVRNVILVNGESNDLTALIDNNSFELGNTNYWTVGASTDTGARSTSNPTYAMSNSDGDWLFNTWSQGIPITQNLGTLPAGKYSLSAVVGSGGGTVFLTINGEPLCSAKTTSDTSIGYPIQESFVINEDAEVIIGAVGGADDDSFSSAGVWWYKVDNFQLTKEQLLVKDVAIALDANPLVADQWYYYEVPEAGEYTITAGSALANVAYTTNGDDVVTTTNTSQFSASMTLQAGKYYFKSTTAQTVTFTPLTYTYELGTFTSNPADGAYIQSLETATFTFADAYTNDPAAALAILNSDAKALLAKGSETVGEGTLSIEDKVLTATFSGVTLDPASQYTLTIPAGTVGFAGQVSNEAITLTLNTPTVFDGTYYLYDASAKLFFGRGSSWGTKAVVDKYGVPFNWKTDATGIGSIEFIDWLGVYLFETADGLIFTDNQSTGWIFNKVTDGYNLLNKDGSKYTNNDGDVVSFCDASDATVWTFMNKADHDAILAAYPADNEANVATAASVSDDLATYIATLTAVDMTDKIGTARFNGAIGDWTFTQVRGQDWQPAYGTDWAEVFQATGSYTQTIEGLSPGIYKVTVNAFERRGSNDVAYNLGENGYDNVIGSYLSANGEQVQIASWYEGAEKNGNSYKPNSTDEAVVKFNEGKYVNEVYAYVGEDGKLTITINKPSYTPGCWMIFNNFTLTYYAEPVIVNIGEIGYATLYYQNLNLEIPSDVTVSIVNDIENGKTLSLTELTDVIPAGTGVILNGPKGDYTFNVVTESEPVSLDNMLKGTDEDQTINAEGYKYYVLTTKDNDPASVGFYYNVAGGESVNNKAHRAYLAVPEDSNPANEFLFQNADGITTILQNANSANGEVYTISGTRVNGKVLTKGVYIVNGQKVVIK